MGTKTTTTEVRSRDYTRFGVRHSGTVAKGHMADVTPGVSVRLYGMDYNRVDGPRPYDKTFRIGDTAEYDSYNLHYLGTITAIGAKTVSILDGFGKTHRLDLYDFDWRNYDLDLAKIADRNFDVMMHV